MSPEFNSSVLDPVLFESQLLLLDRWFVLKPGIAPASFFICPLYATHGPLYFMYKSPSGQHRFSKQSLRSLAVCAKSNFRHSSCFSTVLA
jgi:hypothetical protein